MLRSYQSIAVVKIGIFIKALNSLNSTLNEIKYQGFRDINAKPLLLFMVVINCSAVD